MSKLLDSHSQKIAQDPFSDELFVLEQQEIGTKVLRFGENQSQKNQSLNQSISSGKKENEEPIWEEKTLLSEPETLLQGKEKSSSMLVESVVKDESNREESYCQPDCLRFCPANSTDQIEFSLSGFTAKAKTPSQIARANKAFSEGVHYWEFICPISCSTLQIGITNRNQSIEVFQNFRTTTPRVVGVEINLEKLTLNFWLNGRYLKERIKKLPENHQWTPTIKFKEQDYIVILNPFVQGKGSQDEANTNYLPKALRVNEQQLFKNYLSSVISNVIMVWDLKVNQQIESVDLEINKLLKLSIEDQESIITHKNLKSSVKDPQDIYISILKFQTQKHALKFYQNNIKDHKMLHSDEIINAMMKKTKLGDDIKELMTLTITQLFFNDPFDTMILSSSQGEGSHNEFNKKIKEVSLSIQEKKNNKEQKISQSKNDHSEISQISYNESSDKLLLASGSDLKLIHRVQQDFNLRKYGNFNLYPKSPQDLIRLIVNEIQIKKILELLDWDKLNPQFQLLIISFLDDVSQSLNEEFIVLSYREALISVMIMLNIALTQYEEIEALFEKLETIDISLQYMGQAPSKVDKQGKKLLSIIDIHALLSILLNWEDQLWAMIQTDAVTPQIKSLWPQSCSRTHTAYGRLSSLIMFPKSLDKNLNLDPLIIADAGVYNSQDNQMKLVMFQDFKVELENIFETFTKKNTLLLALEKQFPNNLMLKGLPTWNVELNSTLNSFPPQTHTNKSNSTQSEDIQWIKQLPESDFILTGSSDGSINIWNTRTKLQLISKHNFKEKLDRNKASIKSQEKTDLEINQSDKNTKIIIKNLKKDIPEDILFTMFDEQEAAEITEEVNFTNENQELIGQDFYGIMLLNSQKSSNDDKPVENAKEEEKVKDVKDRPKSGDKNNQESVEPNKDLLDKLLQMGFGIDIASKALIQTKNESINVAMDVLMELQTSEANKTKETVKKFTSTTKIQSWICEICTFINEAGKTICEVCGTPAPQSSYVIVKNEVEETQVTEDKKQDEILEQNKEPEGQQKEEDIKNQIIDEVKKEEPDTRYVVDYLFSSINNCKDTKPLLVGSVIQNDKNCQVSLIRMGYVKNYLSQFVNSEINPISRVSNIPFQTMDKCINHLFEMHQALIESYYPVFLQTQMLNKKWNINTNKHQTQIMSREEVGLVEFNFSKVTQICQIGNNLQEDKPIFMLITGISNEDDQEQTKILRISISKNEDKQDLVIETVDNPSQIFSKLKMEGKVQKYHYSENPQHLIVQTNNDTNQFLYLLDLVIDPKNNELELKIAKSLKLKHNDEILYKNNNLFFRSGDGFQQLNIKLRDQENWQKQVIQKISDQKIIDEKEILKIKIDPKEINFPNLLKYEKLMNGKILSLQSNAQIQKVIAQKELNKKFNFLKHQWTEDQIKDQVLDVKFQHKTSLINLQIDINFSCENTQELYDSLVAQNQNLQGNQPLNFISGSLGGQSSSIDAQANQQQQIVNKEQQYLPLVIHHHKGASYNQQFLVGKILLDNNQMFASNYPKPEFYIQHQNGHYMKIQKLTLRSQLTSKCGAQPLGQALVFCSDDLSAFQYTTSFHKFNKLAYLEWKEQRKKVPSQLMPYEPVAFFDFENDTQQTIDVDLQKPCKYIFLKPVGFRKTQNQSNQNFNNVPMEMEFFGATGSSYDNIDQFSSPNENSSDFRIDQLKLDTKYSLEIKEDKSESSFQNDLQDIQVHHLQGLNLNISPQSWLFFTNNNKREFQITGKSEIKINDSQLQLQQFSGLKIKVIDNGEKLWKIKGVQVKVIVQDQEQNTLSCLLSPKFYSVINQELAKCLSSENTDLQIKQYLMRFFIKLIKIDKEFIPLILDEINLESFIKVNLLTKNQNFSQIFEFLQHFQEISAFRTKFYSIISQFISELPNMVIPYEGYQALLELLQWIIPMNPDKILSLLMSTVYEQICKMKMDQIQTEEYISLRSKYQTNNYSFDKFVFKQNNQLQNLAKGNQIDQDSAKNSFQNINLPITSMIKTKNELNHIYDISLSYQSFLTDVKIFFGQMDQSQYKLNIKILSKDQLVYMNDYDESSFSLYSNSNIAKQKTLANYLHIYNLEVEAEELKVVISYVITSSTLPKTNPKVKAPDTLVELYGYLSNPSISESEMKKTIDENCQAFWKEGAEIIKLRDSLEHAQIAESTVKFKLIPWNQVPINKIQPKTEEKQQVEAPSDNKQITSKMQEIELLQQELIGKIRGNDQNINEIVGQILTLQTYLTAQSPQVSNQNNQIIQSLEYYNTMTCDFTKIIRQIVKNFKIRRENIISITKKLFTNTDLHEICLEFFKRFIIYDYGQIKQEILIFVQEIIFPIMQSDEKKKFTYKVIQEFLSKPSSYYSQKQIIEALNNVGVSVEDLINFLITQLNFKENQSPNVSEPSQFIMMASTFMMILHGLKKEIIPEPGQAIHYGIECNLCQTKNIIGWRYKDGSCDQDENFCSKCFEKHQAEHPNNVFLIIKDRLPYQIQNSNNKQKQYKPLLPEFKFLEGTDLSKSQVFNCENCGKNPIQGFVYRCSNCEDYNLCHDCFTENKYDHFSYHIFFRVHKPLEKSNLNPITLLQVLDPRLYSFKNQEQYVLDNQDIEDQNSQDEDLQPLNLMRSSSMPISQQEQTTRNNQGTIKHIDHDQQFIFLFKTCEWICTSQKSNFDTQQKSILLKLSIEIMFELIKLVNINYIYEIINTKDAFLNILLNILQMKNEELLNLFQNLLENLRFPPVLQRKIKEVSLSTQQEEKKALKTQEGKQQLNDFTKQNIKILELMIFKFQKLIKWMIDIELQPDLAKLQIPQLNQAHQLYGVYQQSQFIWLDHLSIIIDQFIKSNQTLKEIEDQKKQFDEKTQPTNNDTNKDAIDTQPEFETEDDLPPLIASRSVSLPIQKSLTQVNSQHITVISLQLIKNLIQLLDQSKFRSKQTSKVQSKQYETLNKYLSSIWSLILKSITCVSINQLIEGKIFDSLIYVFIESTEEIQLIIFPQILSISETIAKQSHNENETSIFISNLLFNTLENINNNQNERVIYSICQGWLDILINQQNPQKPDDKNNVIFAKMSAHEVSKFLKKTSKFLIQFLNKGSFEGVSGCTQNIIMKLNLASDLLYILRHAQSKNKKGNLAIQELFAHTSSNKKLLSDLQQSISMLLTWLVLNSRTNRDEVVMSQLGNQSSFTPATKVVKKMSELIEEILFLLPENEQNEDSIKVSLNSLMQIVQKMNSTLIELSQNNQIGFDITMKMSQKVNNYFIKFLKEWLISDSVASYFVFNLSGFEYLLDTIGLGIDNGASLNTHSSPQRYEADQLIKNNFDGDILELFENKTDPKQQEKKDQLKKEEAQPLPSIVSSQDEQNVIHIQEFSKTMIMMANNSGDPVANHAKTDWSVNKRAYKHRIVIKNLTGNLKNEYWIMFNLPNPVEIKEIQIGFNNYWGSDTEVYAEPLSVVVEAGMTENNLSLVCNLQIIKDDAFGSVSSTVFGKNLQTFVMSNSDLTLTNIQDIIQQKLQSISNFKVQYVKFCMRRYALTCLENSPLSIKINKQVAFGINYISILGLDTNKLGSHSSANQIIQDQKKTAMEVLSIICQGDFHQILKVIANEKKTIQKMKMSFNLLLSLVNIKKNLIEPTFIAISSYNIEMGDWIIEQFLSNNQENSHASLVGEIVLCNKQELARRMKILQNHVMNELTSISKQERSNHGTMLKKLLPLIKVFIYSLRISTTELTDTAIELNINEIQVLNIVSLLSTATQEREQQTKILIQLLVLIIYPPHPFQNQEIDSFNFTFSKLLDFDALDSQQQKWNLISILSSTSNKISQEIFNKKIKLDKLLGITQSIEDNNVEVKEQLLDSMRFWLNLSFDQFVKEEFIKMKMPIMIYQSLRQFNPKDSGQIIKQNQFFADNDIQLVIELIKVLISGHPALEEEMAQQLIEDLKYLSEVRDMNYVNKVFLQLLKVEKTIPICICPYDAENKRLLPNYRPIQALEAQKNNQLQSHQNFIQSDLLKGESKSVFVKNFKEILNANSKNQAKKILTSQWTLCHSQKENGTVQQFQGFWKNIENKAPAIIIVRTESTSGGSGSIFGCYCAKGIPQMPGSITQDSDYVVLSSPEDFCFCYIQDKSFHHFKPKAGISILSLFTDYEGGGAISIANDFILVSFSYDFAFTVGMQLDLEKIQETSNPNPSIPVPESNQTFKQMEIWSINQAQTQTQQLQAQKQRLASFTQNPQGSSSSSTGYQYFDIQQFEEFKHPWINEYNPLNNFRANPVFLVPSHLKLSEFSKIMLGTNVQFKVPFNNSFSKNDDTIEQYYSQLHKEKGVFEKHNCILDLQYDISQLLDQQNEEAVQSSIDLFQEENILNISGYVPKMGIFERFEEQEGVKQIISVTLQSLKLWKSQEVSKSWELWLKELESFSKIPLFFQLFLKDTKCKDLLFKVLAGQPDLEISAETGKNEVKTKWDDEQKQAVQFNYKILSETFSISNDLKIREIAIECGLLSRILERLGQISGEKTRVYKESEEKVEEIKKEEEKETTQITQSAEKNIDKKKRKGVGYSSKVGQTFNVNEYLENKKQRNEQIKNLVDIFTNFLNTKQWKANENVEIIILESPLLPLLESAFRNGSWLDMAKESEVYHSYLGLTRALASQKNLVSCLLEVDPRYEPAQTEAIYKLLARLHDLANIFINCLNQQTKQEHQSRQVLDLQQPPKNQDSAIKEQDYLINLLQSSYQNYNLQQDFYSTNSLLHEIEEQKNNIVSNSNLSSNYGMATDIIKQIIQTKDIAKNQLIGKDYVIQETNEESPSSKEESKKTIEDDWEDQVSDWESEGGTIYQEEQKSSKLVQVLKNCKEVEEMKSLKEKNVDDNSLQWKSDSDQSYENSMEESKFKPFLHKQGYMKQNKGENQKIISNAIKKNVVYGNSIQIYNQGKQSFKKSKTQMIGQESESEYDSSSYGNEKSGFETPEYPIPLSHASSSLSQQNKFKLGSKKGLTSVQSKSPSASSSNSSHSSSQEYDTEEEHTIQSKSEKSFNFEIDSEIPENLAKDVTKTYKIVQQAIEKRKTKHQEENFINNALNLPLFQSYIQLLSPLRFDYMDMKDPNDLTGQHYKHHYQSIAGQNQNPPSSKMVRLAQELADLSNALPNEHTNAIFVRVDSSRVDMMKALVCGASNTPYAHGCFEFDIFCDNNYPRDPPKMNLITTGNGTVRFNPNLYACGKVCLSLLGTWRGSATENWDPKLSTILQVLLSTQAIIMSEEVYFNEPGFENEAGTPEGEKKNEGYQNIVRYANVKFAMLEQIKRPSKGFETVIKRHFYLKKHEILKEVHHWIELASKNEAAYAGLVNDHNYNWANQFKATKTKYKEMLVTVVQQLEDELNKLDKPTDFEITQQSSKKDQQKNKKKKQAITEGQVDLENVDVESDEEEQSQIKQNSKKEINIEDEAVKDRWSRYIGAMGIDAVAKQSSANIFLSGLGSLGAEIAKNLVLSGCKEFVIHDTKKISSKDFSGQFFLNYEEDFVKKQNNLNQTRAETCLHRIQQLNYYVKCSLAKQVPIPLDSAILSGESWNLKKFDVVILTEASYEQIIFVNDYCKENKIKFICADTYGVFSRVFNDFGKSFEILDKNGEELQDVMIKNVTNEEKGTVELLPNNKHRFEDGDEVVFQEIEGMKLLAGEKHDDASIKSDSINDTIHIVTVVNPYCFKIGDTRKFEKYQRNGIAKQLKVKKAIDFKSFKDSMLKGNEELPFDQNLFISDFEKISNNILSHICFEALDIFKSKYLRIPDPWDKKDADEFVNNCKEVGLRYDEKYKDLPQDSFDIKYFYLFSFQCQGIFNPMCAFIGGFVAQECVKAITSKFTPNSQAFYYDAIEVLPEFDPKEDLIKQDQQSYFEKVYVQEKIKTMPINSRYDGLRIVLGQDLVEKIAYTRLFMIGAGAIGCELLKNYAMLGIGTGPANPKTKQKSGGIVLTDPDVIEVSNLNRQFLFREKHLRKPKSSTAAAAAIQMNKDLKANIIARLDKVHEGTSNIFTDQFFEELTVVTNALDNIQARLYIDARCVVAKTPLLESGTLGPKGHVQVVIPYQSESYGSQNDPEDNNEIPHCTLKMFPEETLHCVEWARDKFGQMFTIGPQSVLKILQEKDNYQPTSQQDTMALKKCIKILKSRPKTFDQCVEFARMKFEKYFNHDIKQLLHVYPLDTKTKDGNLFWTMPKRPPVPTEFEKKNPLHCQFIAACACLRATIFKIPIPSDKPRSEEFKMELGNLANKFQPPKFVPNDEKAKEIQKSVDKEANKEEEKKEEDKQEDEEQKYDLESLMNQYKLLYKDLPQSKGKKFSEFLIQEQQFEKDNDQNYHIDFIYTLSNLRASNYKLELMDWLTVKLKAGRIVPALATTTASIAGLQTLELVKLLKGCKKTDHRNIFLNLAVPLIQASEPGDAIKTKILENLETTLWDRWDIKLGKDVKLSQVIKYIEETYKGLQVRDVMKGNAPIYFYAIMNAPGKEKDKELALNQKIKAINGVDPDDKYVDVNVTCVKEGDLEEKIISGIPTVRIFFE